MTAQEIVTKTGGKMSRWEIVLFLWLCGFSYKEIAEAMTIARASVNAHLSHAQEKYEYKTRSEMKRAMFEKMFEKMQSSIHTVYK